MAAKFSTESILKAALIIGSFLFLNPSLQAQEKPPIPVKVEVRNSRFLNFGSFTSGVSGGTVTVDYTGTRTSSTNVFLLNFGTPASAALFDLTANPGTLITITTPGDFYLTGDGGTSGEIRLEINSFSTGHTFITTAMPPLTNVIEVGGTLHIGSDTQSPPGYYSGTFNLIFNYE